VSAADRLLMEELYPMLHRFAAATAPWDVEADDLLQDALTRVIARGPLSSLDHPAAYLRKTMTNLAMNHYRHGGVRRRAMARVVASDATLASDSYPSDLADLAALPPRTRAILYLAEVDGYTYDEIGTLVGCSATAARMAAMRGRRSLKVSISGGAP
jgi:RNA polymerase sigma-70 factor (ECF subfamily)